MTEDTAPAPTDTAAAPPPAEHPPLVIDEKEFSALNVLRERLTEATDDYNEKADAAKSAKKVMDAASETFIKAFDRFVRQTKGETDLPLFDQPTQNEINDRAMARAHVHQICGRAKEVARMELDPLVVGGWTDQEIIDMEGWLDDVESTPEGESWPMPPPFVMGDGGKAGTDEPPADASAPSENVVPADLAVFPARKRGRKRKTNGSGS